MLLECALRDRSEAKAREREEDGIHLKIKRMHTLFVILAACAAILLTGCGSGREGSFVTGKHYHSAQDNEEDKEETDTIEETESSDETVIGTDIFVILQNDMREECLILEQLASGKQYMYYYSVTTRFLDKYGNRATVSDFEPGRVMTVGSKDIKGRLLEAQLSDQVWEYPDVTRYSVDEERGVFTIAGSNYSYDTNLFVHSDGNRKQLSDLTELDTLRIVGIGKKILSVSITTGHGKLRLENTELFEGSFIQIGSKIFSEITYNMSMELPEGTYVVAVANNGYGGSTEIEIKQGKETVLDLDTLKGEGPRTGNILFAVDVVGAQLLIDGEVVDYSQPVPLQYGVHTLTVSADSYDTYSKKLFVNSEKATIVIGLSGDDSGTTSGTGTSNAENSQGTASSDGNTTGAGSLAGSLAGSHSTSNSSGTTVNAGSDAELDAIVDSLLDDEEDDSTSDYLSTLTELLSSLAGTE